MCGKDKLTSISSPGGFEEVEILHYEVGNKLWNLSQDSREGGADHTWIGRVSEETDEYQA
jgi:hypothetical protein